jgi:hypothetical protein
VCLIPFIFYLCIDFRETEIDSRSTIPEAGVDLLIETVIQDAPTDCSNLSLDTSLVEETLPLEDEWAYLSSSTK